MFMKKANASLGSLIVCCYDNMMNNGKYKTYHAYPLGDFSLGYILMNLCA